MKKVKEIIIKYGSTLTACVFTISALAINTTCCFFFHEPEVPKELLEYRKDK
ncbi:MAG: cyclic lactone autoinducer peptide [Oscillospiraceae bacterium]|nr:cyclic lactone autoinducer peptide [Oscillospiraceae bacterium]